MWDPARWISNLGDLLGLSESSDLEKASLALWLMRCGSTRLVCVKTSVSLCVRVINVDAAPREKKKKKLCYDPNPERSWRWDHVSVCLWASVGRLSVTFPVWLLDFLQVSYGCSYSTVSIEQALNESYILRDQDYVFKSTAINNLYRRCSCVFHDFIKTTKTTMTSKMTRRLTLVWPGLKLGIQFSTWPHFTWRPGGGPLMLLWWGLMSFHGWIKNSNGSV